MKRNFYNRPHKALRAMMADTLVAVGRMDPEDECDVRDTLARLEELLAACESHVKHENAHVHRAMEAKRPGSSCALAEEHVGHLAAIEDLRAAATARVPDLQRRLAIFIAENLEHMEHEEREGNRLLAELFTEAEIDAIERELVGSIPPGELMQFLRWMLPALHHGERIEILQGMRHAPGPAFPAAMGIARTHLRVEDFTRLETALGQRAPATLAS